MKNFIFATLAVFLTTGAFAQNVQWGAKTGLNAAFEINSDDGSTDARPGLYVGVFSDINLGRKLSLQPELVYSMQGAKYEGYTDKLDYINLPIMLRIYVLKRELSIDVGPQFGYMVNAKIKHGGSTIDIIDDIDNKFDVALGFGVSYTLLERFDFGFRCNIGTIEIINNSDLYNMVFQFGVGYRF